MQLKSLKVFCDIVGHRSFSRAAAENGLSQSGASQTVHHIEDELGVKLIDRSKRPFVLTPEGELFHEGCRGVVERYYALEETVRRRHQELAGRVRVLSIPSVGLHHMQRCIREFQTRHPRAEVRLEYAQPARVYEGVEHDQADLGLVSYPKPSRTHEVIEWRREPLVLVCAPDNPLAQRATVTPEDLDGCRTIAYDSALPIRRELDRALQAQGVALRVVREFDNIEHIKRAVEIDDGIALLPEPTVRREVESGTMVAVPLAGDGLVRPLGIICRRGRELTDAARQFIEFLQTADGLQAGDGNGQPADDAADNGRGNGAGAASPPSAQAQTS